MWRLADQQLDEFVADGQLRVHQRVRPAVRHARRRRPARRARGGPPAVPRGLRAQRQAPVRSARRPDGDRHSTRSPGSTSSFAAYIEDRRARAARRRAHRAGARQRTPTARRPTVIDGRAHGDVPVRRRPGDHRPPARRRAEVPRRAPRAAGRAARATASRIPDFIEEALRIESPVKSRLPARPPHDRPSAASTSPAGTPVMLLNGAANRDPAAVRVPGRVPHRPPERREHIAFGRGAHSCPGGPLARAEGRVSASSASSTGCATSGSSEEHHGPAGDRRFDYEPTWVLRGLHRAPPRVHARRVS